MRLLIKDALNLAVGRLQKAGISEPRISAQYLIQHVLNLDSIGLRLTLNSELDESANKAFNKLIERRLNHEPVQYILGYVDFYNTRLNVDPRVLIPRPETEELIDRLIQLLVNRDGLRILDIGTGSGNIAIALAANLDNTAITAIDISDDAIALAAENARINDVEQYIHFIRADIFENDFWKNRAQFDVIVSNPPYVAADDFQTLQPEIREFEPKQALISANDVYAFYREISRRARLYLHENGLLCFEIGFNQAEAVSGIIQENLPDFKIEIHNDLSNIPRIVIAIK